MPRLTLRLVTALCTVLAGSAYAQTSPSLMLRAVRPNIGSAVVAHIARNARPFELSADFRFGQSPTGRAIAKRLCGTPSDPFYWAMVREMNVGLPADPDVPLADPQAIVWPRCLYVEPYPNGRSVRVELRDTPGHIYLRFTGSAGTPGPMAKFFGVASITELAKTIKPGQMLTITYRTLPVNVTPRDGNRSAFESELRKLAAAGGEPIEAMLQIGEPPQGRIVVAEPSVPPDGPKDPPVCATSDRPPFDVAAVVLAYGRARDSVKALKNGELPRPARVVLVDNGFFGADPNVQPPFEGSPFPPAYFRPGANGESLLAQRLNIRTKDLREDGQYEDAEYVDPINFVHLLVPDETSGHGTHVTGLVLGGPDFKDKLALLRNGAPWAQITILNVGKGGDGLLTGAYYHVGQLLAIADQRGQIVNMSIAYEPSPNMWAAFDAMRQKVADLKGLLVVAAGNGGGLLSTAGLLPGSLGGAASPNLITVAAHDAVGVVPTFSKYDNSSVDIAGPGCGIYSWLDNTGHTTPLNGTSMATPLVTFAASLLASLTDDPNGRDLKSRLIAAADLLPDSEAGKTAYGGIRLNVAKSLYFMDDYLRDEKEELLGKLVRLPSGTLLCQGEAFPRVQDELWSIKRRASGTAVLYLGRRNKVVDRVCNAAGPGTQELSFQPTHSVTAAGIDPVADTSLRRVPLKNVQELVLGNSN